MESNWIYWDGGLCPLKKGTKIDICHRDGEKFFNAEVGESAAEDWSHDGSTADIIAYRLTFMIDPQKRTIEAMALELDRVNAENAALKASLSAPQAAGWQPIETCKPFDGLVAYIGFDDGFYSLARYCDFTDDKGRVQFWSLSDYHGPDIYKTYGNMWEPDKWFAVPSLIPAPVPRLSEQDAPTVEAIREQFENWLTGEGDLPHLKYKNFGGSYITDEACMKWDAYKAGFKAALQNAAE